MKRLVLSLLSCLLFSSLVAKAEREGNFKIRFEPTALLQTGVEVPFEVKVWDVRQQPATDVRVIVAISRPNEERSLKSDALRVGTGVYVAKPMFPSAGQWNVEVRVRKDDTVTTKVMSFNVAQ